MPPKKAKKVEQSKADDSFSNSSTSNSAASECPLKKKTKPPKDPCHLYKITVTEKWPAAPKKPEPPKPDTDQGALEKKIADKMSEIDKAQMKLDTTYNVSRAQEARAKILSLQEELLEMIRKRCEIGPPVTVWSPPEGERVFTIVKEYPSGYEKKLNQAEAKTRKLKKALLDHLRDWHQYHKALEDAKKELNLYDKSVEKLAKARDYARQEMEEARLLVDLCKDVLRRQSNSPPDGYLGRFWEGFKGLFGQDSVSKLESAEKDYAKKRATHKAAVAGFNDYKTGKEYKKVVKKVKDARTALIKKTVAIRETSEELTTHEKTHLEMRNTLISGGDPIQMVAGEEKRYWKDWDSKDMAAHDRTPDVTVEIDMDSKPEGPASYTYCSDKKPYAGCKGPHPYLMVKGISAFIGEPVLAETTGGKKAELKIWQAPQLDWPGRGPLILALFFKVLRQLFSFWPFHRKYLIQAESCGWDPAGNPVTQNLNIVVDVIPADSYVFTLKTNAFAGIGGSTEYKVQKASEPSAQSGLLQYESSGSSKEITRTNSMNAQIGWGMVSHSESTSHVTGYDKSGALEKDLTVKQFESRLGTQVTTTTKANGEFRGEAYSAERKVERNYSSDGTSWEDTFDVNESGNIANRTDKDGNLLEQDQYQSDKIQNAASTQTYNAKGASLSRIPGPPSSLFPFVPIDISIQRNGYEDDFMATIKGALSLIIWITRQSVMYVQRLQQVVPSMGWKVGFNVDFLIGAFSYEHAFREHIDQRVWHYHKGSIDVKLVTGKIYLFGGFWVELFALELKFGAEINATGNFSMQGMVENTHPDAIVDTQVGYGATGSFGFGIEIKLIVGQADWCSASAACTAALTLNGTAWVKHEDGPHKEVDFNFDGIIGTMSFSLLLVGNIRKKHEFVKPRNIYTGIWPKPTEDDLLERQNAEMEEEREAAAKEAQELEKKLAKKKKKK